jgi:hypothetical protein
MQYSHTNLLQGNRSHGTDFLKTAPPKKNSLEAVKQPQRYNPKNQFLEP